MRTLLLGLLLLFPVEAFAQQAQPSMAYRQLESTIGSLVGQNALLSEQVQQLAAQITDLKKQLADKDKKSDAPPDPKK